MKRDDLRQDFGLMPGVNNSPVNPSFRDGNQRPPTGRLWVGPVCAVVGLVLLVAIILVTT